MDDSQCLDQYLVQQYFHNHLLALDYVYNDFSTQVLLSIFPLAREVDAANLTYAAAWSSTLNLDENYR